MLAKFLLKILLLVTVAVHVATCWQFHIKGYPPTDEPSKPEVEVPAGVSTTTDNENPKPNTATSVLGQKSEFESGTVGVAGQSQEPIGDEKPNPDAASQETVGAPEKEPSLLPKGQNRNPNKEL